MLKIKKVYARKYRSIIEDTIEFPDKGVVLVTGHNKTSGGYMQSVAAGKTALGELLAKGLFGVTRKKSSRASKWSHRKSGDTYVKIDAEISGQPLIVEFGYKCKELNPGGEGMRFQFGSEPPVQRGKITETAEELAKLVQVNSAVAAWTVYVDGEALNFGELSEGSTVSLLMNALNQPPWEAYFARSDYYVKAFDSQIGQLANQLIGARHLQQEAVTQNQEASRVLQLAQSEYDDAIKAQAQRAADRENRKLAIEAEIVELQAKIKKTSAKMKELEAKDAEAVARLDAELGRLADELAVEARNGRKAAGEVSRASSELAGKRKKAAELEAAKSNYSSSSKTLFAATVKQKQAEFQQERDTANQKLLSTTNSLSAARVTLSSVSKTPACPIASCGKDWPISPAEQAKITAAKKKVDDLEVEIAADRAKVASLGQVLFKEPEYVETPWPKEFELGELKQSIESLEVVVQQAQDSVASSMSLSADLAEKQAAAQKQLEALKSATDIEELSADLEQDQQQLEYDNQQLQEIALQAASDIVDSTTLQDAKLTASKTSTVEDEATATCDRLVSEQVEAEQARQAAAYWKAAFGPFGIPNMVLEEALPTLNAVSKKISQIMTGGLLSVSYSTTKTLASGESRPEIQLSIVNGMWADDADSTSKGETGLVNFITAETLAEVGCIASRVGFRWYDEITKAQDERLRRSLFEYMRMLADSLGILVFVVDHSTEVASYADYVLMAEKTVDQGTKYIWQN